MSSKNKLWREVPSFVFVALARRGMERISLDQCFLPDCDNDDIKKLEPLDIEESDNEQKNIKIIKMKCHKCDGIFSFKLETLKKVAKPTKSGTKDNNNKEKALSMGIAYALDEDGNNLGQIGFY
jgi:hypothetical protein